MCPLSSGSGEPHAAVDHDRLSGDVGSIGGGEEGDDSGDVGRRLQPSQRDGLGHRVHRRARGLTGTAGHGFVDGLPHPRFGNPPAVDIGGGGVGGGGFRGGGGGSNG